jgi:hypothetical protein
MALFLAAGKVIGNLPANHFRKLVSNKDSNFFLLKSLSVTFCSSSGGKKIDPTGMMKVALVKVIDDVKTNTRLMAQKDVFFI